MLRIRCRSVPPSIPFPRWVRRNSDRSSRARQRAESVSQSVVADPGTVSSRQRAGGVAGGVCGGAHRRRNPARRNPVSGLGSVAPGWVGCGCCGVVSGCCGAGRDRQRQHDRRGRVISQAGSAPVAPGRSQGGVVVEARGTRREAEPGSVSRARSCPPAAFGALGGGVRGATAEA